MIKVRIGKKKSPCGESKNKGFGQGTPPKGEWYKKQEIYLEEETKLLRELTEDELERALAAVEEIDPDELAFNQIFGDKKRLVIDFPVADRDSDAGKFINMWTEMPDAGTNGNYNVDWEKGLVSGIRTLQDSSTGALVNTLAMHLGDKVKEPKQKKVQMKIGKWLAKVHDIASKRQEIIQLFWKKRHEKLFKGDRPYRGGQTNFSGIPTGEIEDLIGEEKLGRYDQLTDQLRMYAGDRGITSYGQFPHTAIEQGKYWQTNAAFIKQNINKMSNDKYAIVITRDPVDIFRMSDFDQISSCHSPPSRPSPSGNSFYKCAVAEAMGHGAVAYVVSMTSLLAAADAETLQEAESNIQEGELFSDETRGSHVGYEMDLQPLSRIRLRQYRYYPSAAKATDAADYAKPSIEGGVQLAVPETGHIPYGLQVPGFMERLEDWAREHQQEAMAGVPKNSHDKIDAGAFVLYGGSYEESNSAEPMGRRKMLASFFGVRFDEIHGEPRQDTSTERKLPKEIGQGIIEWTETAVAQVVMRWNQDWARQGGMPSHPALSVSAHVEDHGEDEAGVREFSINGDAVMRIFWSINEWEKLPHYDSAGWVEDEMKEYGYGFVKDLVIIKRGSTVYAKFDINNEGTYSFYNHGSPVEADLAHTSVAYSPDSFEEYCVALDTIDDQREGIKAVLSRIFKQQGWLEGGAFMQLAMDIENDELTSYEWDLESDGEYEDSYEATATITHDFDAAELNVTPEVLSGILESREFRLLVRHQFLDELQKEVGVDFHLDIDQTTVRDIGGTLRYTFAFQVTADDPTGRVNLFRALVEEIDDEDDIAARFEKAMAHARNNMKPVAYQKNLDELAVRWKEFL